MEQARESWLEGAVSASELPMGNWSTQESLHFLSTMPDDISVERMAELDAAFELTEAQNAEIIARWLQESVERGYEPAYVRLEPFLTSVGRRKFLTPLYEAMVKTPEGKQRAAAIYEKARSGYHPIAQATVDQILAGD